MQKLRDHDSLEILPLMLAKIRQLRLYFMIVRYRDFSVRKNFPNFSLHAKRLSDSLNAEKPIHVVILRHDETDPAAPIVSLLFFVKLA